jgi:hypothetical protein
MPYKMHDPRTDAEVRADSAAARGSALERKLLEKLGANFAAEALGHNGAERALESARTTGAMGFLGQLERMAEADRVLQLAWDAGVFKEAIWGDRTVPMRLREHDVDAVVQDIKRVAYDLLAEQYADLHVKVRLDAWVDVHRMNKCPARTFGGSEEAVRR